MKITLSNVFRAVAPVAKTVAVAIVTREVAKIAIKSGISAGAAGAVIDAVLAKKPAASGDGA